MKSSDIFRRHAPGMIFGLQLAGLPLISFLPSSLGVPSRPFVIFLYIFLILSYCILMVLFRNEINLNFDNFTLLFFYFILMYIIKIIISFLFSPPSYAPGLTTQEFASYLFLVSLPAFIYSFTMARIFYYKYFFNWLFIMLCVFLLSSVYYNLSDGGLIASRMAANEVLNPITTGQLASMAMLLGVYRVTSVCEKEIGGNARLLLLPFVFLAIVVMVFSVSKGPLIAGALTLAVTLTAGYWQGRKLAVILALVTVLTLLALVLTNAESFGVSLDFLFDESSLSSAGDSNFERLTLLMEAKRVISDNPLWGADPVLRLPLYDPYPHNIIVEAFMATGIFGGIPFVVAMGGASLRAVKGVLIGRPGAWVGLLFIMIFIGNLFSGNLYYNLPLWSVLGVFLGMQARIRAGDPGLQVLDGGR